MIDSDPQDGILRRLFCGLAVLLSIALPNEPLARWQSGYAAACKAVDAGSIPTLASIFPSVCPGGGIGRRCGLKIRCPKGRAGSSPAPGTNKNNYLSSISQNSLESDT